MKPIDPTRWSQSGNLDSPEGKRIAVLVIHGIGQQRQLETLDKFARGLCKTLNASDSNESGCKYIPYHYQVPYKAAKPHELWLENYIHLEAESSETVFDIYEFYWAHHMTDTATLKDIDQWLKDISRYARQYYPKKQEKKQRDEIKQKRNEYPAMRKLFKRNGSFHRVGYILVLGRMIRMALFCLKYLEDTVLRRIPVIYTIYQMLRRWISKVLVDYWGDVVVYTSIDRKARFNNIRRQIIKEARLAIQALIGRAEYKSVFIAGHSLGSVIAYDALSRLHKLPLNENDKENQAMKKSLRKIKGLITFGSPLDKIAFYYRDQSSEKEFVRNSMIRNIYNFKKKPDEKLPSIDQKAEQTIVIDKTAKSFNWVKWLNFHHGKDPVSGHLDLYEIDDSDQEQLKFETSLWKAHIGYWKDPEMYQKILDKLIIPNILHGQ